MAVPGWCKRSAHDCWTPPGRELPPEGGALAELAHLDVAPLHAALDGVTIIVASDVDNPLLGPRGAAAVFGPQKGAGPRQVETLEHALRHWSQLVGDAIGRYDAERPGAGAAGGTGFAALALLDADIKPGIELILDLIDFERRIAGADLVVTGEGSLDEQSMAGKAPVGVARAAARAGIPVIAVAGRLQLSPVQLREAGISGVSAVGPRARSCPQHRKRKSSAA
jgi:glycerate 2-kinase